MLTVYLSKTGGTYINTTHITAIFEVVTLSFINTSSKLYSIRFLKRRMLSEVVPDRNSWFN